MKNISLSSIDFEKIRDSEKLKESFRTLIMTFSLCIALIISGLILFVTDSSPLDVFSSILKGSFGSKASIVMTLNHTAPILCVATGAVIAGRADLLNIGQEGQIIIGALFAVAVGLYMPGPRWVVLPLILITATVAGALWAGIAATMKFKRGVNEVISTLLLIVVASQIVSFAVNRSWLLREDEPEGYGAPLARTNAIESENLMPVLSQGAGFRLNAGILVAVFTTVAITLILNRTRWGFYLRMTGMNSDTAKAQGVSTGLLGSSALLISGAFAGLSGGVILTGSAYRVSDGFSSGYGWTGLLAAFVANLNPKMLIPSALLFGAIRAGGGVLTSTGVSTNIVGVIQGLIVLSVVVPSVIFKTIDRNKSSMSLKLDRT